MKKNIVFLFLFFLSLLLSDCGTKHYASRGEMPEFPIPYPIPSTVDEIQLDKGILGETLGDVNNLLSNALDKCEYHRKSYFYISEGFALVTQLERIKEDGTSMPKEQRWVDEGNRIPIFSLSDYIRRLFLAEPGYYRTIVFLVSNQPLSASKTTVSKDDVYRWLDEGASRLTKDISEKEIAEDYSILALIYEFRKSEGQHLAELLVPSKLQGRTHLVKSKILNHLLD